VPVIMFRIMSVGYLYNADHVSLLFILTDYKMLPSYACLILDSISNFPQIDYVTCSKDDLLLERQCRRSWWLSGWALASWSEGCELKSPAALNLERWNRYWLFLSQNVGIWKFTALSPAKNFSLTMYMETSSIPVKGCKI
jgi:hypothetical protein